MKNKNVKLDENFCLLMEKHTFDCSNKMRLKKQVYIAILLLLLPIISFATHNRAGEILYKHINNFTYEIIIYTYTDPGSAAADRCSLLVKFGDGKEAIAPRVNGASTQSCPDIGTARNGQNINSLVKLNIYSVVHTFSGPGEYALTVEDPNRVSNIQNISNSVNVLFALKSLLIIDPSVTFVNAPQLKFPPIDEGCVNKVFQHNPGVIDVDGDSLHFRLGSCLGKDSDPLVEFVQVDQISPGPNNTLSIDAKTGTITWDSPKLSGRFNICFYIEKYRMNQNGVMVKVSEVLRDMQVNIGSCLNDPPTIDPIPDVCVVAGDSIYQLITARDSGNVRLYAEGYPLEVSTSPANFVQGIQSVQQVSTPFTWRTHCSHIRRYPYLMNYKAEDSGFGSAQPLTAYRSNSIQVIAPQPLNPSATPQGNNILLNWDVSVCSNIELYHVYRRIDSIGFPFQHCVTGVPASSGFVKIATVNGHSTNSYLDNDGGNGFFHGQNYCYIVTAGLIDGSESYASEIFCAQLKLDVPVITRVSVNVTDMVNGSDSVEWAKPKEMDTTAFPPPYYYKVYRNNAYIASTAPSNNLGGADTVFVDSLINTKDKSNTYHVEIISGVQEYLAGSTHKAQSMFLGAIPSDNTLNLSWDVNVPWTNHSYEIFRLNDSTLTYEFIDTSSTPNYSDTGLINDKEYCYYIKSIGSYSASGLKSPLINYSQIFCGEPKDTTAPCPPYQAIIFGDCEYGTVEIEWKKPEVICPDADDVVKYKIYNTPILGGKFLPIDSITGKENTNYEYRNSKSIAGCYAITAIDNAGNESKFSNILCVDNCPEYRLPNIITPGGDGINDLFIPFPYKYVESINLQIFNRWGTLVFETTNPDINWNAGIMGSDKFVPDGVYFYVCDVFERRLTGIEKRTITGNVSVFFQKNIIKKEN